MAQEIFFVASAPEEVAAGQQFLVSFIVNSSDVSHFMWPAKPEYNIDWLEVLKGPVTSNISSGKTTRFTYTVMATDQGTQVIPPASVVDGEGNTLQSKALALVVTDKIVSKYDANEIDNDILSHWRGMEGRSFTTIHKSPDYRQIVINKYETNYQFSDGMLAVCNTETGKWGFYDENGNMLPGGFKWEKGMSDRIPAFSAGYCIVTRHVERSGYRPQLYYVIDKQGREKLIEGLEDVKRVWPFNNGGIAAVELNAWAAFGPVVFYNTKGQRVMSNIKARSGYGDPIGDFIDGWARVGLEDGCTFVDRSGKLMPVKFKQAQGFSEGLAAVAVDTQNGRRWGFINTQGKMVIQPRFSKEPTPFSGGYSVVKKQNDMMVFINKEGKVCGEEAQWYTNFVKGYAFGANGNEKWIVDTRMQRHEVASGASVDVSGLAQHLPVRTVFDGRYIVSAYGGYYGSGYDESRLYDPKTGLRYEMAPYNRHFDHISPRRIHVSFRSSTALKEDQQGFVDENGLLVLEFVKDEF